MLEVKVQGIEELKKEIREFGGNLHKANVVGLKKAAKMVAKKANETARQKGYSQKEYFTMLGEAKSLKRSEGSAGIKVGTKVIKGLTNDRKSLVQNRTGRSTILPAPKKNRVKYYKEMKDYFYMRFVEFGTKKQRKQNIVSNAIKSEEGNIAKSVSEALSDMLGKLKGIIKGEK